MFPLVLILGLSKNKVPLPDEYDRILTDLLPYRGLSAATLVRDMPLNTGHPADPSPSAFHSTSAWIWPARP